MTGWMAKDSFAFLAGGFFVGAFFGTIVSALVSYMLFPSPNGQVAVVKVGFESLPLTLKGDITTCLLASLACCLFAVICFNADFKSIGMPIICSGFVIGIAMALSSSRMAKNDSSCDLRRYT